MLEETDIRTRTENQDILLSAAINGMFLNSELFGHQRGQSNKGYKLVRYGDLILSMQNLHLGNANVNMRFEHGMVSPAYKTYKILGCSSELLSHWVKSNKAKEFFFNATTVGASICRRNVEWETLYDQIILLPQAEEQSKIANFLSLISERIEKQQKLISTLKLYKRGVIAHYFTTQMRNTKPQKTTISKCLFYEQPQKYIVHSEHYSDIYTTPVLTANKAFILGYTNEKDGIYNKGEVLIYDDFTMEVKYVNFPFKVKSSTIKMLTPQKNIDLYFMYSLLQYLELKPEGHQRSYISILEPTEVQIPIYEEQIRAAKLFRLLDSKIEKEQILLQKIIKMKASLMQQLFI